MKFITFTITIIGLLLIAPVLMASDNDGRIYGKILTVDGDTFEGLIRWDKNEASWVDLLNGTKSRDRHDSRKRSSKRRSYRDRDNEINLFGITIKTGRNSFVVYSDRSESGVRFGHIRSMEVVDDDRVLIELKSGEEIEFSNGSTDIGTSIREIVIEDEAEGEIELDWDDIDRIEFSSTKTQGKSSMGERLWGTLQTRRGGEFTGYICWDVDEVLTRDVLDGETKRRSRKIKFNKIKAIERYSSSAAEVTLLDDETIVLRGSNDVDDSNRGIIVSDPVFGQVMVEWNEFDRVDFSPPPKQAVYSDFDGGKRLRGKVFTEDGEEYEGEIRWDDDEEYTWEMLDGEYRRMTFDIEFGAIRSIERDGYSGSTITLWDGRQFDLRDSNDVDEDNKGIYITLSDGDEVEVEWEDFERIEFSKN